MAVKGWWRSYNHVTPSTLGLHCWQTCTSIKCWTNCQFLLVTQINYTLADFGCAIELDPQYANAYYNGASAHARLRHTAEACDWLEKTIALDAKYRQMARTDTNLIRGAPCFQALLQTE